MNEPLAQLIDGMKQHPSIDARFRNELVTFISNNSSSMKVIAKKYKFDIDFYKLFIKEVLNDHPGTSIDESRYYKNFKRLKKFKLIHKSSAYSFSKSLSLISINPNHVSLLTYEFEKIDLFVKQRKNIIEKISLNNQYVLYYVYIYLRCFTIRPLSKYELGSILQEHTIILNKSLVAQYFNINKVLGLDSMYHLYVYDWNISNAMNKLNFTKGCLFEDIEKYEKEFLKYKKNFLDNIHMQQLKYINRNYYLFQNSPLYVSIYSGMVQSVSLSLLELNKLFPNTITVDLLNKEEQLLKSVLKKNYIERDEDEVVEIKVMPEDLISGVEISEIDELSEFLSDKRNFFNQKEINKVISGVELYLKVIDNSIHAKLFFEYIIYLLNFVGAKKLRASTVRGYIYTLNKHILKPIEDLNHVQQHEMAFIQNRLISGKYKPSSIKSITRIINHFLNYHNKQGVTIDILGSSYPKSMIFDDEYENILDKLEETYKGKRLSKYVKFEMLQQLILVIFAFNSGMRRNELRTRELSDMHVYENDNTIYIDVNNQGLRKQKLKLKTNSSKRRIKIKLDDRSMKIFSEWYSLRQALNKRTQYLFLERSLTGRFLNKVIPESVFDTINVVIKSVTQRHCTFHSFRHSFATYRLAKILQKTKQPYALIELAMELGHITPEETLRSYSHVYLLHLMSSTSKGLP